MAQPIIEKLKVNYVKYVNGEESTYSCLLKDIPEEDKQFIVSLAILPVFNKDGSENKQKKDISEYIIDFPILTTLAYPSQFTSIDVGKIQRTGCPNLKTIIQTTNKNLENSSTPCIIKGAKEVSVDNSDKEDIKSFANMVTDDQKVALVFEVPVNTATKSKARSMTKYLTFEEFDRKMSSLNEKLEEIRSIVDNPDKIPTMNDFEKLKALVGRITSDQFDEIVSAIQGVNVNIEKSVLQNAVDEAMQAGINKVLAQESLKTNKDLQNLTLEIENIRNSDREDNEKENAVLELLKTSIPSLIGSNKAFLDRVLMKISNASEQSDNIHEKLDDADSYRDLILEEFAKLGNEIQSACKEVNLGHDGQEYLTNLLSIYANEIATQIQNGDQSLFNEIRNNFKNVVTVNEVENIVSSKINELSQSLNTNNIRLNSVMTDVICDRIIAAMNGLADKNSSDMQYIKDHIDKMFEDEAFTDKIVDVLKDTDIAKVQDIQSIKDLIGKNHSEEISKIGEITDKLSEMPTLSNVQDLLEAYYAKFSSAINTHDKNIVGYLEQILEGSKENGMTIDDLKNFISSKEGREILTSVFNFTKLQNDNQTIIQNQAELFEQTSRIQKDIQSLINLGMGVYNGAYGLAQGVVANGSTTATSSPVAGAYGFIPGGFAQYIANPYVFQTPSYSTATPNEMQTMINNAVRQQLQLMFGLHGVQIPGQPSDINDKDKTIQELNAKIAQKDQEIADLKKQVSELNAKLDEVLKLLKDKNVEENNKSENPNPDEKKPDEKKTDAKKPETKKSEATNAPKNKLVEPTIKVPEPVEKLFIKDSIDNMNKLAEPKMTTGKKLKKWIARHPLALTAIGIGAGALLGAGAGVIMAGGVSAMIAKAAWFIPTLQTIGIGAGVGLGLGAVGEIVARVTGAGKKSRLYSKFQKEREKCQQFREEMEKTDKQIELAQANLNQTRELQRKGNKILKKLGVYKFATNFNRRNLRKLKAQARIQKSEYKDKVDKFLLAKEQLNQEEKRTGKTTAMGGYLQKLRNAENKYSAQAMEAMSRGADEDEIEDIKEEYQDVKNEIIEDAGQDISSLSHNFQTGDNEAEDLINSVKGAKTETMRAVEEDIKRRNAKVKPEIVKAKYYDPEVLSAYKKVVDEKGNDADKENLQKLMEYTQQTQKKLNEIKATPIEDYVSKHPEHKQQIADLLRRAQEKAAEKTAEKTANKTTEKSDEHTK